MTGPTLKPIPDGYPPHPDAGNMTGGSALPASGRPNTQYKARARAPMISLQQHVNAGSPYRNALRSICNAATLLILGCATVAALLILIAG